VCLEWGVCRSKSEKLLKEKTLLHDLCRAQRMLMDYVLGSLQEMEFTVLSMASNDLQVESTKSIVTNPDVVVNGDVTLSQPRFCMLESDALVVQHMQQKCLQDLHLKHKTQHTTMLA
jgi:hypothetical protein